jgi:hypothetical protein
LRRDLRRRGADLAADGWPEAVAAVVALFALQLVLFQLAEETGFLQDRWQDRYTPGSAVSHPCTAGNHESRTGGALRLIPLLRRENGRRLGGIRFSLAVVVGADL